jgi:hypothetical protein
MRSVLIRQFLYAIRRHEFLKSLTPKVDAVFHPTWLLT